jgi:hypothetical protein
MGERRGAYRVLVGKPEGKRPLGRPGHRWEFIVWMDLKSAGREWYGLMWFRLGVSGGPL